MREPSVFYPLKTEVQKMIALILSFFLVSLSLWIPWCGVLASAFGYTLFFHAMLRQTLSLQRRFLLASTWFGLIQAVQLSWVTSTVYMGPCILFVYLFAILFLGAEFGLLVFFFQRNTIAFKHCFSLAGAWVLLEWSRMYVLTGLTWNPVALSLANSPYAIQFASLFGVYGLSFWILWTNVLILRTKKYLPLALVPYLFGYVQQTFVEHTIPPETNLSVALVQTALLPEQKERFVEAPAAFIPPLDQWERIWASLKEHPLPLDLIVLPEAALPLGAHRSFYPAPLTQFVWELYFPAFTPPSSPKLSNAFLAQSLASHFQSDVILGLDDEKYNAAFHFHPHLPPTRYEKRILVPMGEYVPFQSDFLAEQFAIGDSFRKGELPTVFPSIVPIGVSICLEEIYSSLLREQRHRGARLFVNISNDAWFPGTHLPMHHFLHGRLRSAEHGVCTLRACNTGVTGAIDCFGAPIQTLPPSETQEKTLFLSLPVRSFSTLYTWWGDAPILFFSLFFLLLGWYSPKTIRGVH